jgi:hypothetical protein
MHDEPRLFQPFQLRSPTLRNRIVRRDLLHNPNWPLDAAGKLGVGPPFATVPPAYGYWLEERAGAGFGGRPSTWQSGIEPTHLT